MKIGVLDLQGAVSEHLEILDKTLQEMGIEGEVIRVKSSNQLDDLQGLVIPGGESTVIGKLAEKLEIIPKLKDAASAGLPILGTCAGMVMLAKAVEDAKCGETKQPVLGVMDIKVLRNAFGRQRESFEVDLEIPKIDKKPFRAVFIRAPVVEKILNEQVEILAFYENKVVAVQQKSILATAFHPELTEDTRLYKYFIKLAQDYKRL